MVPASAIHVLLRNIQVEENGLSLQPEKDAGWWNVLCRTIWWWSLCSFFIFRLTHQRDSADFLSCGTVLTNRIITWCLFFLSTVNPRVNWTTNDVAAWAERLTVALIESRCLWNDSSLFLCFLSLLRLAQAFRLQASLQTNSRDRLQSIYLTLKNKVSVRALTSWVREKLVFVMVYGLEQAAAVWWIFCRLMLICSPNCQTDVSHSSCCTHKPPSLQTLDACVWTTIMKWS